MILDKKDTHRFNMQNWKQRIEHIKNKILRNFSDS